MAAGEKPIARESAKENIYLRTSNPVARCPRQVTLLHPAGGRIIRWTPVKRSAPIDGPYSPLGDSASGREGAINPDLEEVFDGPSAALWAVVLTTLPLSLSVSVSAFGAGAEPERRPNIVLIVADDQGYGDASCYGAKDVRMPHLDGLAAGGVRFTQFRVNPLCAPTRARS